MLAITHSTYNKLLTRRVSIICVNYFLADRKDTLCILSKLNLESVLIRKCKQTCVDLYTSQLLALLVLITESMSRFIRRCWHSSVITHDIKAYKKLFTSIYHTSVITSEYYLMCIACILKDNPQIFFKMC